MKKLIPIISLLSFLMLQGFCIKENDKTNPLFEDSLRVINLNFIGDIMCHSPQLEYAQVSKDSFDFRPTFQEVKKYLSSADLTFGNLETVIGGKANGYSGYPLFNSPEHLLDALKDSGIDLLFTSNNHSLDKGIDGAINTIQQIKKRGLINVGTYSSQKDRDSLLLLNINGIKLGILSYTYGVNGNYLPKSKNYIVNIIDTNIVKDDITKMQKYYPDLILVYFHFGEEYSRTPSAFQTEIVKKTFNYGADIIIGSHPHVIQPLDYYEKIKGKLKKGVIAYSLGNFLSNQRWRYSDAGVILNLEIVKNTKTDSTWVSNLNIIPTWVFKGKINGKNGFVILPSDPTLLNNLQEYLSESDKEKLIESYYDTLEILFKK